MTPPYSPPHCEATHLLSAATLHQRAVPERLTWQPAEDANLVAHTAASQKRVQCTSVIRHTADGQHCCCNIHPDRLTEVHTKDSKRDLNFEDGLNTRDSEKIIVMQSDSPQKPLTVTYPEVGKENQTQRSLSGPDDKSNIPQHVSSVPVYSQIPPVSSLSTTVVRKPITAFESPRQHQLLTLTHTTEAKTPHCFFCPGLYSWGSGCTRAPNAPCPSAGRFRSVHSASAGDTWWQQVTSHCACTSSYVAAGTTKPTAARGVPCTKLCMFAWGLQQNLLQELPPQGPLEDAHR